MTSVRELLEFAFEVAADASPRDAEKIGDACTVALAAVDKLVAELATVTRERDTYLIRARAAGQDAEAAETGMSKALEMERAAAQKRDELRDFIRGLEWAGSDTEGSECACPSCGTWKCVRIHAYGCPLAMIIGAECKGDTADPPR